MAAFSAAELYEHRRRMGVLFQHGALFTDLSVFDNVAFPMRELTPAARSSDSRFGDFEIKCRRPARRRKADAV